MYSAALSVESWPVWLLYLVTIVPLFRFLKLTLDAWANQVRDVLWVRRNRRERSIIAAGLLAVLAYNRVAFADHLRLVAAKEVPLLFRAHFGAVIDVDPSLPKRRLLVIGEVGDGKSTLVSALRDPAVSPVPETGKRARGITKKITNYAGLPINGQRIELLDTPGIGDMDITPTKLISLLEERLGSHNQAHVDGVLVTTPVADGRIKLGAQVVATRVESAADGAIAASARGGTSSAAFAARCCALLPTTFAALASCSSPAACTASRAVLARDAGRSVFGAADGDHSITTVSSLTRHSRFPSADQSKPARRSSASTALPGLLFQLTPLRSSISSTLVCE